MLVVEGGAVGAAAVRFARKRPRRSRVRREPIDLEQITADFAEPRKRPQHEIIAALEAEVQRVKVAAAPLVEPKTLIPLGPVHPDAEPANEPAQPAHPEGLPLDQLRAWLDQVQSDLEKVQVRIEFLHLEHHRLEDQRHLVSELITSRETV